MDVLFDLQAGLFTVFLGDLLEQCRERALRRIVRLRDVLDSSVGSVVRRCLVHSVICKVHELVLDVLASRSLVGLSAESSQTFA